MAQTNEFVQQAGAELVTTIRTVWRDMTEAYMAFQKGQKIPDRWIDKTNYVPIWEMRKAL